MSTNGTNGTNGSHPPASSNGRSHRPPAAEPIAIIGMRGRFPGADDLDRFWQNLANGVESIATLSAEEMRAAGVPDRHLALAGLRQRVAASSTTSTSSTRSSSASRRATPRSPIRSIGSFSRPPGKRSRMPATTRRPIPGAIGVFGGCEMSTYLYQLYSEPRGARLHRRHAADGHQRQGPSLHAGVVSARICAGRASSCRPTCSTSLVAVSLACESLQAGRCDMALAGGVTVRVPQRGGYFYTPGSILSPDGHCRPFDANAQGTIVGSGVGLVVLQAARRRAAPTATRSARSSSASASTTTATTRSAIPRPSFRGQAAAIRAAHAMAGVVAGVDRLRRGARHRHDPRRPDRGVRADRGLHGSTRPSAASAASAR